MNNGILTGSQLLENPSKYIGKEILLRDVRLIEGSVIKYKNNFDDNISRLSFYCLLELDNDSGLVLPFGIKDHYVQEVRLTTYNCLLRASEGKLVSARGKIENIKLDTRDLEEIIVEVPNIVDNLHQKGYTLPRDAEKIANNIDRSIVGKLVDFDGINLHNHFYMEGYIIPHFRLLSNLNS